MALAGIIFDIKKYAIHDGPGIRTTVFFKGCPLNCRWCHNPECKNPEPETFRVKRRQSGPENRIIEKTETIGVEMSVEEVAEEIKKDIIFYDQSGGGVTMSGGEPMMQIDFLEELLKKCKSVGIHCALDTSGYASSKDFERIYDLVDLFLYDIKLIDEKKHIGYTGLGNKQVLDNLTILAGRGNKINIRIPLIPDLTDTAENLSAIAEFLLSLRNIFNISLLPFNKFGGDKRHRFGINNEMENPDIQSTDQIEMKAAEFEKYGFQVKIGG